MPGGGSADGEPGAGSPGAAAEQVAERSLFPRLSHTQWENTVRDLLRLDAPPGLSASFTTDPLGGVFDNNEFVLQVTPGLWGDYQRAAEELAGRVVSDAGLLSRVVPADLPAEPDAKARASHRIDGDGDEGPPIEGAMLLHHEIDRIHARMFRYLLDKLSSYQLGSSNLLDCGVAVWLNDLADKYHGYQNVPYILVGKAGGFLKTGQFVDVGGVNNNKLLSTIGAAVGCTDGAGGPLDSFGDASLAKGLIGEIIA